MKKQPVVIKGKIRLANFETDYCGGLEKSDTKAKTEESAQRIGELQQLLYANSSSAVLLVLQGMDASGKDGAGRQVLQHVNPLGVATTNFKAPSSEERAHDFLWRVHKAVPPYGFIGVFNRSHYEAVLAERVLKIVPKKVWTTRYQQIVNFERMLAANNIVVLKFYLHISKEEQAERFRERLTQPHKYWKFNHADLTARQHWEDYIQAYEEMINRTSHEAVPWHVVPADRNWYRDYVITRAVAEAMEGLRMKWPKPVEDFSKIKFK